MQLAIKLWGDVPGDRYILAIPRPGKRKGSDYQFKTTAEALEFAEKMNRENHCVFFSQALFVPGTSRKQVNALTVRSFWLDLDVEPGNAKKYETQDEAKIALAQFINRLNLPVPTLVCSGVGLQAHWILSDRIDRERWEKSAGALKNAAKRLGLKQDTTRTADIASVMRLPGTQHLKDFDNPQPVFVFGDLMPDITIEEFEHCVARYIVLTAAHIRNKTFQTDLPQRPNDANKVADGCGVVAAMRDTKGCVPEPIWMHVGQLLHHTTDGERIFHEWSSGHPDYDEDAAQAKYDSKADLGPTLCSTFEDRWGEGSPCLTCPHRGKITSPIQLGASMTPAFGLTVATPQPVSIKEQGAVADPTPNDLQYVPQGYTVGREGVWFHDEESEKDLPVLRDSPLVLETLDQSLHGGQTEATFKWQTPTGVIKREKLKVSDLSDLKTVGRWLYDNNLTGFQMRNVELVRDYMQASIHLYNSKNDPGLFHDTWGWTPETHPQQGFVIGDRIITATGVYPAKLNARIPAALAKGFGEKGTLEGWAECTEYIKAERYMPHQFTLLMMLASPLFELVGFQGSMVSLVGKTGMGKSTSAYMGMSAFGVNLRSKKSKPLEIGAGSSEKSFRERWVIAHNLPCLIDEAHTIKQHKVDIGQLVYDAVNGTMRDVLMRNSTLRPSDNFNLVTVLGCNDPFLDHPLKVISEAARMRIFEFNLGPEHVIIKADAVKVYSIVKENYGVAGRVYIEEVIKLKDFIETQEKAIKQSYANSPLPPDYRFKQFDVGMARLAGEICEKLGIIRFDYRQTIEWAAKQIELDAKTKVAPETATSECLAEYERSHQAKFTIIRDEDSWLLGGVIGECAGRYDKLKSGWTLAVPKKVFQQFAREHGVDQHALKQWEKVNSVKTQNVRLTQIMSSTTWCYVIKIEGPSE